MSGMLQASTLAILMTLAFAPVAMAEVPLTWGPTGHVTAPVVVNGEGPYPFVIDTAADESAVYNWFATAHAMPNGRSSEISGATGTQTETTTRLDSLSLDGQEIRNLEAGTAPDRADGARLAGIVGVDLMTGHLAVLDLGCDTVALLPPDTDPASVAGRDATMIEAGGLREGKQLTLPVSLNGASGVATLDTGARSTIINHAFARAAGLDLDSGAFRSGTLVRGASQQAVASVVGPIGAVRFAGVARAHVVARIVELPVFQEEGLADQPMMNLGLDLLHGVRLTIDYRQRRFWVAPSLCR